MMVNMVLANLATDRIGEIARNREAHALAATRFGKNESVYTNNFSRSID
jgi:hypothetical protein